MAAEAAQVANEIAKEGLLGTFGVNWKLFLAQLVNFSVVLFILWKWVFTPAMTALENRRKAIERGLDDAEKAGMARQNAEREREAAILAAREEARRILEEAQAGSERARKEAVEAARREVAEVVAQGKAKLAEEKEAAVLAAKAELAELVIASTEKVLGETASKDRERGLIQSAVQKLLGKV